MLNWEWQEDSRDAWVRVFFKCQTLVVASSNEKTAFDARPPVVSRIVTDLGTHGHVVAGPLEEIMDVRGSACCENCETEFRCSWCFRQGSVEAPVIRIVQSREDMEGQGMEGHVRWTRSQRISIQWYDVRR